MGNVCLGFIELFILLEMESVLEKLDPNAPDEFLTALKKFNTEVSS